MSNKISQTQNILYNSVPDQTLTYANQLTVYAWNDIINMLRTQANVNAEYIQTLHKWLIGIGTDTYALPSTYTSFVEYTFDIDNNLNIISSRVEKFEEYASNIVNALTYNRLGLLKVTDYDEDTGEVVYIFDPTIVDDISYDEESGEIAITY